MLFPAAPPVFHPACPARAEDGPEWSRPDVLVIGGGVAALAAALTARHMGARVLLCDQAPAAMRGGNSRHGRNFRAVHPAPTLFSPGVYPEEAFLADLQAIGGGNNPLLARLLAQQSAMVPGWLMAHGVALQRPENGPLPWSRKTVFLLGGGTAMIHALYASARRCGIRIVHEAAATALSLADSSVLLDRAGHSQVLRPAAVVAACGGFQANREWLRRFWGPAADRFILRGTPFASGQILESLLAQGVAAVGDPKALHLVATDAASPPVDGGIISRVDGIPWGVVVDQEGRRFHDEGADISPTRHTHWGQRIAACPEQQAYLILDAAAEARVPLAAFPATRANDLDTLAQSLKINPAQLGATLAAFNAAPRTAGPDGPATLHLVPPKSRRAFPLETPPFSARGIRPGITFSCQGVAVDSCARLLTVNGTPCQTLFAAGMIIAPNLLGSGYLAGAAITLGVVFGRIAGQGAAAAARGVAPESLPAPCLPAAAR